MKYRTMFITGTVLVMMLLAACGQGPNKGDGTAVNQYRVSESTGLYSALAIDADQLAVLPQGAMLVPADGETTLFCDTFTEGGMKYALCKVQVPDTGQMGWVLQMFIEKN